MAVRTRQQLVLRPY